MSRRTLTLPSLALTLALAIAAPALAQPKPAQLQAAGSEIAFTTKQMGVPVEGKFSKFSAQITLDPKKPETGSVSFSIDTGSARFGSAEIDAEVPKATWLNVAESALTNDKVALAVLTMSQIVAPDGYVAKLRAKGYAVQEPE